MLHVTEHTMMRAQHWGLSPASSANTNNMLFELTVANSLVPATEMSQGTNRAGCWPVRNLAEAPWMIFSPLLWNPRPSCVELGYKLE